MGIVRSVSVAAVVMGLSACATGDGVFDITHYVNYEHKCVANTAKHTNAVNWSNAEVIDVAIRDGAFNPAGVHMTVGDPYVLRIANEDDTWRNFYAGKFLDSVALAQVSTGGATFERPCMLGVSIGAGKTAELRLVPLADGNYYPEDAFLWLPIPTEIYSRTDLGVITVDR